VTDQLLYDLPQAAEMLALSVWTLRAWIRMGKLRPVRLGRRVLLERAELERLIAIGKARA
jgi:excisionase family DNA binding protein